MAHNSRTRADLAAWAVGTVVTSAEFDELDQKTFTAINGDDGGTWNPAAFIGIGGAGLRMSGPLMVLGGHTLTINGSLAISLGGSVSFGSGTTATLATVLACSGAGRVRKRVAAGAVADHTYGIIDGDVIITDSSALASNITYTLSTSTAAKGDEITFKISDASGAYYVLINYGGLSPIRMQGSGGTYANCVTLVATEPTPGNIVWQPTHISRNT